MNSYNSLINKLNRFIKKYYTNKLLRGLLLSFIILISSYLIVSVSEYYAHFSSSVRTIIFFFLLTIFLFVLVGLVLIPIFKLLNIGKLISYKQASGIISNHFPEIKDKLLNVLELQRLNSDSETKNSELINASILQKTEQISVFPFRQAVNFKENYKYLKYLIPVFLIFVFILSFSPYIFSESNKRIINYTQEYEKPAPFKFQLKNDTLTAQKGEDFTISMKITGIYVPKEVFIAFGGNTFLMQNNPKNKTEFSYTFKNINNSLKFNFNADEYNSNTYELNVLPPPVILKFKLKADVPAYTQEEDVEFENTGDIVVPQGTKLYWTFNTADVDSFQFITKNKNFPLNFENNIFTFSKAVYSNFDYTLSIKNKHFSVDNLIDYHINVTPDLYPAISVEELKDTANFFVSYFRGQINDDYGIKNLKFNYRIVPKDTDLKDNRYKFQKLNIPFTASMLKQSFFHTFDFSTLKISDDKVVQYYFQVWDNDGINGSKSSKTQIYEFEIPSYDEIKDLQNQANENIKSKVEQSQKLAQELQNDLNKLQQKNLDGQMSDWEKTQMLQNILDKQKTLEQMLKEASQENKEKNKMQNTFSEKDKKLLEMQKQLEKMLDEIMTDELKDLMKQIQELQRKFDEKQLNKLMENHKFSYDDMQKELERNMELLKKYEIEQKVDNAINELNKLAEKQKELSEKMKDRKSDKQKLAKEQDEIQKRFDAIKEEYDKAKKENEELKNPAKMDDMEKESEEVKKEFEETQKNMKSGKSKKASKSQSKNSENMKKMAQKMQAMMQANSGEMQSENMESLRQIIDNLLTFSFAQEKLQNKFKNISYRDPKYIEYTTEQLNLKSDFYFIKDSIDALAERITQISKPIRKEVSSIKYTLDESLKKLEDRRLRTARNKQVETMTSANNLALLLSEVLNAMQNQEGSGSGSGSGKPKKGKGKSGEGKDGKQQSFEDMKGMQESLKKQMEQMLKQMKDGGQNPGGKAGMNKKMAQMLAQQEIFRQMLKEMQAKQSLNSQTQKLMNEINKMAEKNEKDLVNKRITPQLLERQKMITTKLLEAENAENKRKTENKRESNEAKEKKYKSAEEYFNKKKNGESFRENLYRNNLILKNFYIKLNNDYSGKINN